MTISGVVRLFAGAAAKQVETARSILDDTIHRMPSAFTAEDVPDIERLQLAHEHLLAAQTLLQQLSV